MFNLYLKVVEINHGREYSFIFPEQTETFVLNILKPINIFLDDRIPQPQDEGLSAGDKGLRI